MKALSFLRCAVVIALSLFAGRAGAQIDSNALVHIYCGPISGGCTVDAKCGNNPDEYHGFTISIGLDSSLQLSDVAHTGVLSFQIDTINREIVNLILQRHTEFYYVDPVDGCSGGLNLTFDPIPFIMRGDSIKIISGRYKCDLYSYGFCGYGTHNECTGSCNNNDSTMDSVYFAITPAPSAVRVPAEFANVFRVIPIPSQELFSFNAVAFERALQISDILGMEIFSLSIHAGQTLCQQSLHPGLYFARLGDQVAKFVVPPR